MADLLLSGCQPEPLAGYLKALGILRLVSEQADPAVRGYWSPGGFALRTALSEDDLCTYFLDRYEPTPIVSPWNGGSGFSPKDNTEGLQAILHSGNARLAQYAIVIRAVQEIGPKPDNVEKSDYLMALRNQLPDAALPWIDAATVLTDDGAAFPILLGTGGNDGRFDFSNNFMQRLGDALVLKPVKKAAEGKSSEWLRSSLFATGASALPEGAIGQFDPGSAGGSNSAPQGKGKSLVNPWDFVLMIEGALTFAAASVRKVGERKAVMSVPFTFRDSAAGYSSAATENGRGEIWAPLWGEPATNRSVAALFAEGRITWNGEHARTGLDALRSVATLQHDRRISAFARFVMAERFGLSNVAVPVGRIVAPTRDRSDVQVTAQLDPWLRQVRRAELPGAASSQLRVVDRALFASAQLGQTLDPGPLLVAVLHETFRLEQLLSRSTGGRKKVRPLRGLDAASWLEPLTPLLAASVEARIAWALASGRSRSPDTPRTLREYLVPVTRRGEWAASTIVEGIGHAPSFKLLGQVAMRREWATTTKGNADESRTGSRIAFEFGGRLSSADAVRFAMGDFDQALFSEHLEAFLVLQFDWDTPTAPFGPPTRSMPSIIASVLAHAGSRDPAIPSPTGLVRQLMTQPSAAIRSLDRSVRMRGYIPAIDQGQMPSHWLPATLLLNLAPPAGGFINYCGSPTAKTKRENELAITAAPSAEQSSEAAASTNV